MAEAERACSLLARSDGRARERERDRARFVAPFTKKLARGEAASGDEHGISGTRRLPFSFSDREVNFAYSGFDPETISVLFGSSL